MKTSMERERFSLLLLEPGEVYFEDFSVNLLKPVIADETRRVGRLKLCSKSLVYDPRDVSQPIVKMPFKECRNISIPPVSLQMRETNILTISCDQHIEMLENNTIAPYRFRDEPMQFIFEFNYVRVDDCLTKISQLYRASSLQPCEQNSMIATIVYSRHNRLKFDLLWLEDVCEEVIIDFQVDEIAPLVVNPGRLLLSSKAIYFQPYNNIHPYLVKRIRLSDITSFLKRRFLLRQVGLDIQWKTHEKTDQLYVSFRRDSDREAFYEATRKQEEFTYTDPEPESMILKWQNGLISNYDYLLYLNRRADRTFQDLTQYPVFPWVISDYKSDHLDLTNPKTFRDLKKPIGALNPERLERLIERYEEMAKPKFLYGSHYSTPGFVLFYLVRKYPKLMLCLCYGKFDHPDRMFNKVEEVFNNCLNNMSDFKELIPEFYDTEAKGDFLVNASKINFGCRADGTTVNDVILPPWAKNSPEVFVKTMREALESEYVSQNLHHWIDLIFGYKQQGQEAVDARNLFYFLCYEGAVDLDEVTDMAHRHALEVQISEFGQIPNQLFTRPHVPRVVTNPQASALSPSVPKSPENEEMPLLMDLTLKVKYQAHKDVITSVVVDGTNIISTGKDGVLKCYDFAKQKQLRSVRVTSMPISSCIKLPGANVVVLGSWDNTIMSYDLDYGRTINKIAAHDDAVSCLVYIDSLGLVVSGSWDCSVKIWKGFSSDSSSSFRMSESMKAYLSLEDKVGCLDARCNDGKINVVIGNDLGEIILWTLDVSIVNKCPDPSENTDHSAILSTTSPICGISFNGDGTKVAFCDEMGIFRVIYISDHRTGTVIFQRELCSSTFTCLNWSLNETQVLVGDDQGQIHVWDVWCGKMFSELEAYSGPIWYITRTQDKKKIITAGCDSKCETCIKVWSANYDEDDNLLL
ncbi:protein FAN-like [Phlebotomus papatasi]|uniref:protein FAN-like n=1 Tax=Phlebotomus papatasi TaxID=29031 RepID=UPI0024844DA2|nr:protein FAN-like [Phlebotomus papatasi]